MGKVIKRAKPEKFRFRIEGDEREWELTKINELKASQLLAIGRASGNADKMEALSGVIESECPGLLDELTVSELEAVIAAWTEESALSGES